MRRVVDGSGVERHLGACHVAHPIPAGDRLTMALGDDFVVAPLIDVPANDEIPVTDQGAKGNCTGQMAARKFAAAYFRKTGRVLAFSPDFSYAMVRLETGVPLEEDSGASIPDTMDGLVKRGICRLDEWPDDLPLDYPPETAAKRDAMQHQALLYYYTPNHETVCAAIMQGFSVGIGFTVYGTLMNAHAATTGEVLFPESGARKMGGHAVVIRGWDANKVIGADVGAYRCVNSWGINWGEDGNFWLPRRYMDAGLIHDAVSLRLVEV